MKKGDENDGGDGYATEESEGDFVDVTEMTNWAKINEKTSDREASKLQKPEVKRSQTVRSSMKSPLSHDNEQNGVKTKRTISFNLQPPTKPQVNIEPSKDERLRNLFMTPRWSTSSSEPETPLKVEPENTFHKSSNVVVTSHSPDGDVMAVEIIDKISAPESRNVTFYPDHVRWKSKSLGRNENRKVSLDKIVVKRRHSFNEVSGKAGQPAILRDSAIDLISDDEHSDAYTAVSLAGTLKRNASMAQNSGNRRKYLILVAVLAVVAITIIIILSVLLARK